MDGKHIRIQISRSGKAKIEAFGYGGLDCQTATAPFEQALGLHGGSSTLKEEAFQVSENNLTQEWGS